MELTANLTTLILDTTNYGCDDFAEIEDKIFNSIICVSSFRIRFYNYIRQTVGTIYLCKLFEIP